ncbi:MAG: UDP-N-acetylmuramate--L-alanine ligase [Lachnospiraceae bacterium]|jgi:UDP-N-acetylmuramate--alanine ligase|nr:UDP-N-acetylmuramate--L-alanine ligase [Lachnospiraceae bacterium]
MYQINFAHPIHVYFMGIGGISMSGLAEILLAEGFTVSGSDLRESPLTRSLTQKGAVIFYGQRAENLSPDYFLAHNLPVIDLVVYTSAIKPDNPEYMAMCTLGLSSLSRAELLGQIMQNYSMPIAVSGTHGKTSTTGMVSEILLAANLDPTLSIGGILNSINGNFRIGQSDFFVTEACEYTNSFLSFSPRISMILNIEADHLDFFKDIDDIRQSFRRFAALLPPDGTLIINGNIDHSEIITDGLSCRIITYGDDPSFDYSPSSISYDHLARGTFILKRRNDPDRCEQFTLGSKGEHNVYNSLAAIALADLLDVPSESVHQALVSFTGTQRRFEEKGTRNGITIIDDYAHHPTEITATLKTAQNYPHKKIWCVFQPHTYSRTKAFLDDFASALSLADKVILPDIYAAREKDTLGISSGDLMTAIKNLGTDCFYFPTTNGFTEIEQFIINNCEENDLLITMGAGDVVKIGESLLQ